jgi:hypothetical protein
MKLAIFFARLVKIETGLTSENAHLAAQVKQFPELVRRQGCGCGRLGQPIGQLLVPNGKVSHLRQLLFQSLVFTLPLEPGSVLEEQADREGGYDGEHQSRGEFHFHNCARQIPAAYGDSGGRTTISPSWNWFVRI